MQIMKVNSQYGNDIVAVLDKDDLAELFTIEVCPICGFEQVIWSHGVTACPECNAAMAPCSVCMDERGECDYNNCPYGCDGTDNDSKKQITMPAISVEDAALLYSFL